MELHPSPLGSETHPVNQNAEQPDVVLPGTNIKMLVATSFRCALWSENPQFPDWTVNLRLHSEKPNDLDEKIGFVVISDRHILKEEKDPRTPRGIKVHSRHDIMENKIFSKLLIRGTLFTKLELHAGFFNNSQICPTNLKPTSEVIPILLPHLKNLIMKLKITLALKGSDEGTQGVYYRNHLDYFKNTKARVAKNSWYIIKAFRSPKLISLDIDDAVDWEDESVNKEEFYYWEQPLADFLQRHSSTLKTFKATPITLSEKTGRFNDDQHVPAIQELLFWVKFPTNLSVQWPEEDRDILYLRKIDQMLQLWRDLLKDQKELSTVVWICDSRNPWPYVSHDFTTICRNNSGILNLMLTLHGDEVLRKLQDVEASKPLSLLRNYQIDATTVHGLKALKYLSIACYKTDPQIRNFCFFNLQMLPKTLEKIHIYGIRIMATEIEHLADLPKLKELQIFQPMSQRFTSYDENNGNVEGVTSGALKKLLNARALDKLLIFGFPIQDVLSEEKVNETTADDIPEVQDSPSVTFLGAICGSVEMCVPSINPNNQATADTGSVIGDEKPVILPSSLKMYPTPLQTLLESIGTIAEITDTGMSYSTRDSLLLLRVGEINSEDAFAF